MTKKFFHDLQDMMTDGELNGLFTVKGREIKAKKKPLCRGFKKALQGVDHLAEGVSAHPPGSKARLADLAEFYNMAVLFDAPPSPFNV